MVKETLKRISRRMLVPALKIRANFAAPRLIPNLLSKLEPGATVLNLGCGQGIRDVEISPSLFSNNYWINVDLKAYPGVTCLADAHHIPLREASCDLIINQAMLEHVAVPDLVVAEMRRVLKPGWWLYCEVLFLQPYHPSPTDYQRYTLDGLRQLFRDFDEIEVGIVAGPGNAIKKLLVGYVSLLVNNKLAR